MIYKQPYLEKYKGVGSRHRCPGCGRAKTFTYYLDGETNKVINPRVGRCDREKKCGYHYTPKQYFAEHGGERRDLHSLVDEVPVKRATVSYIAERYVDESMSGESNFVRFLTRHFEESKVAKAVDEYRLGATKNGSVIFWQIDVKGKVRTGKIMQYDIDSCKRVKGQVGSVGWVHTRLAKKHMERYGDFELRQCYFGEHLLEKYPEKPVAVVESEKTAVVCSMIYDEFVWLATGSLHGLNVDKSAALEGRYVMLFPDAGCREQWVGKAREIKASVRCDMRVSDVVERYACDEQKEDGCDLADYVLERVVGASAESDDATQTGCSGGTHRAVKETDEGAKRVTATGDVSDLEVAVETHECEGVDSDTIDVTEYEGCDDDGVFVDDDMRKLLDRGMRRARCMWQDGGEHVSTEHEREELQVEASPPKEGEMRVEAYEKESSPGEGLKEMSSTLRGMVEERPELQLLIEEFGLVEVDMSRYD